ncbi:hypothetical protein [Helicobacter pylori]|uniref:hypothetical protein n=1 Tax=Helicobacter pylori TaxID=210 RepID=UPI0013044D97|nr:hypothetical protein [Helicobacter pylori]
MNIEQATENLLKQIERVRECRYKIATSKQRPSNEALLIIEFLVVELLREGAFNY